MQLTFVEKKNADAAEQEGTNRKLITACAWCRKIRVTDDKWEAKPGLQKFLPRDWITHGICPDCLEQLHREKRLTSSVLAARGGQRCAAARAVAN